jgi:uncharacterized membrane protein
LATFAHRPRLLAGAALMIAAYIPLQLGVEIHEATRLLIAWNVGAWAFLVMILRMVTDPRREASVFSRPEDESQWVLVVLGIVASLAAMAAIVWELGPVKDMSGLRKAEHIGLVAATILSVWIFIHVMFALHYAAEYYMRSGDGVRGGLRFPHEESPDWGEFLYQAFVIGCSTVTADVNATSKAMRRACIVHGVIAFLFNTIILALTINIGAGLI